MKLEHGQVLKTAEEVIAALKTLPPNQPVFVDTLLLNGGSFEYLKVNIDLDGYVTFNLTKYGE